MSRLTIVKQVSPETPRPFSIIETFGTVEGPRTRVCGGVFRSLDEAEAHRDLLQGAKASDRCPDTIDMFAANAGEVG